MLNNQTKMIKFYNCDKCSQYHNNLTDNFDLRVVANEFCSKNEQKNQILRFNGLINSSSVLIISILNI